MTEAHRALSSASMASQALQVPVEQLDSVAQRLQLTDPLLVKIDVQGYEDRVLRGGEKTIRRARLVIVETSFVTLYEDQPLFPDIFETLRAWGFDYASSISQLHHPHTGQVMQEDSLFMKPT
jgi:light-regulated signal transduction histidine kinase (bacteriophytochrome)